MNLDGAAVAARLTMKKSTSKKLPLRVQTLRLLSDETLDLIVGGNPEPAAHGFIMRDTIIIRTGG
jgi:hypothetical protein